MPNIPCLRLTLVFNYYRPARKLDKKKITRKTSWFDDKTKNIFIQKEKAFL